MSKRYILSPEAEQDITEIRDYDVEKAGVQIARYVLREITAALRFVAATPGIGHWREDLTDEAVKFWPVLSYLIVYDPAMQPIGIARVLHAAQDLETLFSKSPPMV